MTENFEQLRAKRNASTKALKEAVAKIWGVQPEDITMPCSISMDPDACYCACATGGPCEHRFTGWREIPPDEEGLGGGGGESVCERCGMGALSHDLRTGL